MIKNGICTLRDIDKCIQSGGKIVGLFNKKKTILSHTDVKYISLPKERKDKNTILVNDKKLINVDYLIISGSRVVSVEEVVNRHDGERHITIWINESGWGIEYDCFTVDLILCITMLCKLSQLDYLIRVCRYKEIKDINNDLNYKILITNNKNDFKQCKNIQNILPFTLVKDINGYINVIKLLKRGLNLPRHINVSCVDEVMTRHITGRLSCSEEYTLWLDAYGEFISINAEDSFIYMPELVVSDPNTITVVDRLVHEYKLLKNMVSKKKDKFEPFEYAMEERLIEGTAKEKVDEYLKVIISKYISYNIKMFKSGKDIIKVLVDFNGFLKKTISMNVAKSMDVYVIAVLPGNNRKNIKLRVYGPDSGMNGIVNSGYINHLAKSLKVTSYSFEYVNV